MQIILKYFSQVKRMNLWELLGTKDWIAHGQGKYKMGKTNTDIYMGIYIYQFTLSFSPVKASERGHPGWKPNSHGTDFDRRLPNQVCFSFQDNVLHVN